MGLFTVDAAMFDHVIEQIRSMEGQKDADPEQIRRLKGPLKQCGKTGRRMHAQLSKLIMAGNHDRAVKLVEAARGDMTLKPWVVPAAIAAFGLLLALGIFLAR